MGCVFCQQQVLHKPVKRCRLLHGDPCGPCSKLKKLKSRIRKAKQDLYDAEKEMTELLRERGELLAQINHVHDPIVGRLPPEIISSIFQFCVPDIPFDTAASYPMVNNYVWEDITSLLALGTICRDWRRIAWSTPQLWKFILVRLDSPTLSRYVDLFREWLGRSGRLPLSIRVYSHHEPADSTEAFKLIDIINQESRRWQMLDLRIDSKFVSNFNGDLQEPSGLQSLRLEGQNVCFKGRNMMPRPINVFLASVRYESVVIQWDNVTWVEAELFYLDECFELLRNAPQIRHCRLSEVRHESGVYFPIPSSVIIHPQIDDLIFDYPDLRVIDKFFDRVSFPSLKKLNFSTGDCEEVFPSRSLVSFFKRSSCRLEKLTIENTLYTMEDIICILQEVPSLVELEILPSLSAEEEENYSPDEFFKLLAKTSIINDGDSEREGPRSIFLPNLRSLRYEAMWTFSWDLLPPMFGPVDELETDNCRRRPLKTFHLEFDSNIPAAAFTIIDKQSTLALLAAVKAGLDLRIDPSFPRNMFPSNILHASMKYHSIDPDDSGDSDMSSSECSTDPDDSDGSDMSSDSECSGSTDSDSE